MDYKWVLFNTVLAIHKRQIAEHGGSDGLRDEGLLLSALARPQNLEAYTDDADLAPLAGAYAFGIAKNHPFIDGNRRTALAVMRTFISLNGGNFVATQEDKYITFLGLAEGRLDAEELVTWIREKLR